MEKAGWGKLLMQILRKSDSCVLLSGASCNSNPSIKMRMKLMKLKIQYSISIVTQDKQRIDKLWRLTDIRAEMMRQLSERSADNSIASIHYILTAYQGHGGTADSPGWHRAKVASQSQGSYSFPFFPVKGFFLFLGSCSWSDVRSWVRDVVGVMKPFEAKS